MAVPDSLPQRIFLLAYNPETPGSSSSRRSFGGIIGTMSKSSMHHPASRPRPGMSSWAMAACRPAVEGTAGSASIVADAYVEEVGERGE